MIVTTSPCTHCGFFLYQSSNSQTICPNNYCPEKFEDCCPFCQSDEKSVRLVRVGAVSFTCKSCGQPWDRCSAGTVSTSSKVVVMSFRKLANAS